MKRNYTELNLSQKIKLIEDLKNGLSVRNAARKYEISVGTVSNLKKHKDLLVDKALQNQPVINHRISRLSGKSLTLDKCLYNWFAAARYRKIPISGTIIQEKARKVSETLEMKDFKASNGWLESFRKRHFISFKALSGESAQVDKRCVDNWKECLPLITKDYELCNIWNLDETGLFWRGLPKKSLVLKDDEAKGCKLEKERLTICMLCAANGEKFKLLVIGKAAMPRAFNKKLPADLIWKSNSKAWMTAKIFMEYLQAFDKNMKEQNRKVLLFLDNAPCHPEVDLDNVKLIYLPPNTTSCTQPLDAGIIKIFKMKYRQILMNHLLLTVEETSDNDNNLKTITVKHATKWISSAWNNVQAQMIINCFNHTGIIKGSFSEISLELEEKTFMATASLLSINDPQIVDEKLQVCDYIDDVNWESSILNQLDEKTPQDTNMEDSASIKVPSINDVMKSIKIISDYGIFNDLKSVSDPISKLENIFLPKKLNLLKSTTLDRYFNKIE